MSTRPTGLAAPSCGACLEDPEVEGPALVSFLYLFLGLLLAFSRARRRSSASDKVALVAVREEEEEVAGRVEGAAAAAAAEGRGSLVRAARHPSEGASLLLTDGKLCKKAVAAVLCDVCRGCMGRVGTWRDQGHTDPCCLHHTNLFPPHPLHPSPSYLSQIVPKATQGPKPPSGGVAPAWSRPVQCTDRRGGVKGGRSDESRVVGEMDGSAGLEAKCCAFVPVYIRMIKSKARR